MAGLGLKCFHDQSPRNYTAGLGLVLQSDAVPVAVLSPAFIAGVLT